MGEFENLVRRKCQPYSLGHQKMYTAAIELLEAVPADVLDIGCGTGFGLHHLLRKKAVRHYVGIDRDERCIEYMKERYRDGNVELICGDFLSWEANREFDFVFCIEVLEHLDNGVHSFLRKAGQLTRKALFLSTPNPDKSPHGMHHPAILRPILENAGFKVACVDWQWTAFYLCEARGEDARC
ncbi:MAG: class I SAM-dependent methyltransferase [Planctomycetota bacterium]|nr:class I SAM-dependent methyltransferase [Planctomycetota bacterium]